LPILKPRLRPDGTDEEKEIRGGAIWNRQKEEGRIKKSKKAAGSTFGCFSGFIIHTS
jgi:hypothetical protein